MEERKIAFNQQLQELWCLDLVGLAGMSNVEPVKVYSMIWGDPVQREEAERVLVALSKFTGKEFNLRNVEVTLSKKEEHHQ